MNEKGYWKYAIWNPSISEMRMVQVVKGSDPLADRPGYEVQAGPFNWKGEFVDK